MKMRKCVIFFSIFLWKSLYAQIFEIERFEEIKNFLKLKESMIIVDLDDTLFIPSQTLGQDVWFFHIYEEYKKTMPSEKALDLALSHWEAVRHLTKVQPVESGTPALISELQDQGYEVFSITTQGLALATRTIEQLKKLNFHLARTAPFGSDDLYFFHPENHHGILYRQGILFTSGAKKGPALINLLKEKDIKPKHVVFIDDKRSSLESVKESLDQIGIPFIGLRYGFGDQRVSNFSSDIAQIQWDHSRLGSIMSDEEAQGILFQKKDQ